MPIKDAGASGDIQAVARAAQILGLFGPQRPLVTVADGASLLGLNRTTANRYFISLEAAGLLERDADHPSAFKPSRLLIQIGLFGVATRRVTLVAPPLMKALAVRTGLTVAMSLWGMTGPVVAHSVDDMPVIATVAVRIGAQLPLTAAQSAVFLAFHEDQLLVERLIGALPLDSQTEIRDRIAALRNGKPLQGVMNVNGINVVAAPVFDATGICATVALLGTTATLETDSSTPRSELERTAREITSRMGGIWPTSTDDLSQTG